MAAALSVGTSCAFILRRAERRKGNPFYVVSAMAFAEVVLALSFTLVLGVDFRGVRIDQVYVGIVWGVFGAIGPLFFLGAIGRGDLSITWTIASLAFATVSLLSIIYPGESVSMLSAAGLFLAVGAIVLLGMDMRERGRSGGNNRPKKGWGAFMTAAFAINTVCLYCLRLSSHFGRVASKNDPELALPTKLAFLLVACGTAWMTSLVLILLIRGTGSIKTGLGYGGAAGTLVFFGFYCTLTAMLDAGVPGHVYFPITTGGANMLVVALSVMLLKERPGRLAWVGLGTGLAALVLLNIAASRH